MHDAPVRVRAVRQDQLPHVLHHQITRVGLLDGGDDRHTTRVTAATQHRDPVVLELSDAPEQDS